MNHHLTLDDNELIYLRDLLNTMIKVYTDRAKNLPVGHTKAHLELKAGICSDIIEVMRDA